VPQILANLLYRTPHVSQVLALCCTHACVACVARGTDTPTVSAPPPVPVPVPPPVPVPVPVPVPPPVGTGPGPGAGPGTGTTTGTGTGAGTGTTRASCSGPELRGVPEFTGQSGDVGALARVELGHSIKCVEPIAKLELDIGELRVDCDGERKER